MIQRAAAEEGEAAFRDDGRTGVGARVVRIHDGNAARTADADAMRGRCVVRPMHPEWGRRMRSGAFCPWAGGGCPACGGAEAKSATRPSARPARAPRCRLGDVENRCSQPQEHRMTAPCPCGVKTGGGVRAARYELSVMTIPPLVLTRSGSLGVISARHAIGGHPMSRCGGHSSRRVYRRCVHE